MSKFKNPNSSGQDDDTASMVSIESGNNIPVRIIERVDRPEKSDNSGFRQETRHERKFSTTTLFNGENISKGEKLISAMGTLEELIAYIGVIKAEHFLVNSDRKFDTANSTKIFLFGFFTMIQEVLQKIVISLGTTQKNVYRHQQTRLKELSMRISDLRSEIAKFENIPKKVNNLHTFTIIPGTTVLESQLFLARALCRRCERQLVATKTDVENILEYLNILGDYFFYFSQHTLFLHSKEPMKTVLFRTEERK